MNLHSLLSQKLKHAMLSIGIADSYDPLIRQSGKPQFGDYQANGVMAAAKALKCPPRDLAVKIVDAVEKDDLIEKLEVAGPGFINIFINNAWLASQCQQVLNDTNLIEKTSSPMTIVADYSAPNVAKQMHVGHLRSTIIGDAVVRVLEYLGHRVIRANHVGDWGTQFGMLIAYLEKVQNEQADNLALQDLENFYRQAKQHYDNDPEFAVKARQYVVKLQSGDSYCHDMWRKLVDITMEQNQSTYDRLNVTLSQQNIMGESLYNPMLPTIVDDLKSKQIAVEDQGAIVVFLDEFKNKDGDPMGVIIQKSDGGFLYTTTDIAAAKYRYEQLHADRVLYFIDSRQSQHLQQAWTIARKAGYLPETVTLEHMNFGMMLGKDNKPFKTRSGDTVKLTDLLDEAQQRAETLIRGKNPELSEDELHNVIEAVAIGAVKYADLSKNRTTDYVFDWDNMLSFEGNTAPYMQYAYSRINSIFTRSAIDPTQLHGMIVINDEKERSLALSLMQFSEVIQNVAQEGSPHLLCAYLYQLAGYFSSFYEHCPILNAEDDLTRNSRLQLAYLTQKTLAQGLDLLGIKTLARM